MTPSAFKLRPRPRANSSLRSFCVRSWNFIDHFREPIGGTTGDEPARTEDGRLWVSLPGYFKTNGYICMGGGKTYHPNLPPANDGNLSWSLGDRAYVNVGDKGGCTSDYFNSSAGGRQEVCPDNKTDLNDFTDHGNLLGMIDDLRYAVAQRKLTGQPFFLNYGLHRPHLPFHAPASFPDETGATVNVSHVPSYSSAMSTYNILYNEDLMYTYLGDRRLLEV